MTGWLLSRPFVFVYDTAKIFAGIVKGDIKLPGKRFYLRFASYALLTGACAAGYFLSPYKLVYNYTPSEELGWYLLREIPKDTPLILDQIYWVEYICPKDEKGECIYSDVVNLQDGMHLIKRVQGLPGYKVSSKTVEGEPHNFILYDDYSLDAGPVKSHLRDGTPVPSLLDTDSGIKIPEGMVYVGNQHAEFAFDSRYFGLVPRERVIGSLEKL
jgi:type IV secretory pathway protease TraF